MGVVSIKRKGGGGGRGSLSEVEEEFLDSLSLEELEVPEVLLDELVLRFFAGPVAIILPEVRTGCTGFFTTDTVAAAGPDGRGNDTTNDRGVALGMLFAIVGVVLGFDFLFACLLAPPL